MPRVSVIIPAYRAETFLGPTLESVLAQTLGEIECIVVDDGSDDGTRGVAEEYARRDRRVRTLSQPNAGPSAARNRGFAAADRSVEHVIFLDADDIWEPDALELLARALHEDSVAVGAHGIVRFVDADGRLFEPGQAERRTRTRLQLVGGRLVRCPPEAPTTFGVLILRDILFTPGNLLVRRACVDRIGGFDPTLHGNEDWDFALRLAAIGHLAFRDAPVLRYRKHPAAKSRGGTPPRSSSASASSSCASCGDRHASATSSGSACGPWTGEWTRWRAGSTSATRGRACMSDGGAGRQDSPKRHSQAALGRPCDPSWAAHRSWPPDARSSCGCELAGP